MRKLKFLLALTALTTLCTACNNTNNAEKIPVQELLGNAPDKIVKDDTEIKVDASVNIPDSKKFHVLTVKDKKFTLKELTDVFSPNTQYKQKSDAIFTAESGETIFVHSGSFRYTTKLGTYVDNVFIDNSFLKKAENQFAYTKECTIAGEKERAVSQGKQALTKLGISAAGEPDVMWLDWETLQKEQEKLLEDSYYRLLLEDGNISFPEKWNPEDSCHFLVFNVKLEEIPILPYSKPFESKEDSMDGSQVLMWISQKGIERVEIREKLYEIISIEKALDELVTMDSVLEQYRQKYGALLLPDYEFKVIGIELLYAPAEKNYKKEEYQMVPTWDILVERTYTGMIIDKKTGAPTKPDTPPVNYVHYLYNGVTGEELI